MRSGGFHILGIVYKKISTFSLGQKGCAYHEKSDYFECAYYERSQYLD